MKHLMVVALSSLAIVTGATDYTWTGGAEDGKWTSADNWSGGVPQPGADNRVIFDPGDGKTVSLSGYSFNFYLPRTIVVKSGTVSFADNAYANDQGGSSVLPLVFDVALNATVRAAFRLERSVFMNVRKEGAGNLVLSNVCGYDSGMAPLGTFEVCAGAVGVSDTVRCTNLVVRTGASFAGAYRVTGKTYGGVTYPARCAIEVEGTVTSPGGTSVNFGYLEGMGSFDFEGSSGTLTLTLPQAGASCSFGGRLGSNVKFSVPETALGTFVLGAEDTLRGNLSNEIDPTHFAFAADVRTFRIASATTLGGRRLCLEDVNGQPVRLVSMPNGTFATEGAGDYLLGSSSATFMGDSLANTGRVGALEGATLQLGGGAAYPTLDFDFTHASAVHAEGTVVFNSSASDVPVVSCGEKGIVETYGEAAFGRIDGIRQLKVYGDATVADGYSDRFYQLIMGTGARLTVNGGEFFNGFRQNPHDAVSTVGYRNGAYLGSAAGTLVLNGGKLYLDRESSVKNPSIQLKGGVFTANETYGASNDSGSPVTVFFDGGEWILSAVPESHYNFVMFKNSEAVSVAVGEGGARLHTGNVTKGDESKFFTYRPFANGVTGGTDGGVEFYGRGTFHPNYPWSIAGPVRLLDGITALEADADLAATSTWFGTGDFSIGSAILDLSPVTSSKSLALATGDGSRLSACGAAAIRLSVSASGAAEHVEIGSASAGEDTAFACERGGVLFLADAGSAQLDGSQSTVKVNGGIGVTAAGLSAFPVFFAKGASGAEIFFTSYDAEKGFVRFADEKSAFGAATDVVSGGQGVVLSVPDKVTAQAAGIRIGTYGALSFGSGASLRLGDGVHAAGVVLGRSAWIGAGAIDFGASPGVVIAADREDDQNAGAISATLSGTAGITFASFPQFGYRRIALNAANSYSGGTHVYATRVSAAAAGCFGTGVVEVGGGERAGGKVYFGTPGTWTNAFRVAGWGMAENASGAESHGYGALAFDADVALSGSVELVRETRMCAFSEGVTATLSGTVSGGRLVAWRGNGTLLLSGSNVYTGGTAIVRSTVAAGRGTSLGTGPVDLDAGVLRFENAEPAVFANDLRGCGMVALKGLAPVTFRGDVAQFSGSLDLCGTRQVFTELPPFTSLTNSSARVATLALAENLGRVRWNGPALESEFRLEVGEGTVLDLGGAEIGVCRLTGDSAGRIINGVVNESHPAKGMLLIVR